jgi:hypothetical protein
MKPDKLTVHDLFQKERRYVVPLYQRAYVWNREEQWEPLWEDIERQCEACLAAENHVSRRSHFLGAIVLNVTKIVGNSVARSEIIDGQQRLTTLQLFLAALRDYAQSCHSTHAAKLARLTINEDERPGSEGSFKVWPTNADRNLFRQVMTANSPDALKQSLDLAGTNSLPRVAEAYLYFSSAIREFAEASPGDANPETRDHRIFGMLQALRTALQIVVIELEENDDPQVIFETLNARGQPLLPSDLIRNFIFMQAANDPDLNADELYNSYWRPFDDERLPSAIKGEDRFWHVEERQGRLTRPRIDLFMFHYLTMKTAGQREDADVLNIGQLFRDFRDWRDSQPMPVETLLADLRAYGRLFSRLIAPSGEDRVAVFAERLKTLDISTVYPLMLFLLGLPAGKLLPVARDAILADVESWLVRRLVCQLTNKNYNRFFTALLAKLKKVTDISILPEVTRAELMRSSDVTTDWPDDVEFKRGWLSKPVYVKSRSDRAAMILRALEDQMRTTRNEAISLPDRLSVEHLLPQKGAIEDYPYAQPMPLQPGETIERCRARLLDTIGNLTLLTQELNSSISNGLFDKKSAAIKDDSDLRLNAWLRDGAVVSWSEADIEARGMRLFDSAKAVWGHPSPAPASAVSDPIGP